MDALPPDPYAALGVAKDATSTAIKSQYRKLVLRLHPDKVQDESLKQDAADKFHRVQTAYEIVGDDDRRQRYDAQCKLAELKRDIEREGGISRGYGDSRPPSSRAPADRGWESYRFGPVSPRYEERRPSYADYFESPRPTSRKDDAYDRPSKRSSPRDSHKKSRTSDRKSKESEKSNREERSKRAEQDVRREREKKFASVQDISSDSEYERVPRRQSEPDTRRSRAAADEGRRRQDEEATNGPFGSERTQKYFAQDSDARAYIARGGFSNQEPPLAERRPSPNRMASSRDHIETIKRDGKSSISYRTGSGRPGLTSRDSRRRSSPRDKDTEIVDAPEETAKRPPPLNKTSSSPEYFRTMFDKPRSGSVQPDFADVPPPPPPMKRAETMPYPATSESRRKESSKSRKEGRNTYPTPEPSPEPPSARKFSYSYVDEPEAASPDGYSPTYQTVYREPPRQSRFTRSPSPVRESREKPRSASKYATPPPPPPPNKRTTSTTYVYPAEAVESSPRPSVSRENSGRLFGEIANARSSRPSKYSPSADEIKFSPKPRAEDIRSATGYKVRRPSEKPHSRSGHSISVR